jgi:hypothetical protein
VEPVYGRKRPTVWLCAYDLQDGTDLQSKDSDQIRTGNMEKHVLQVVFFMHKSFFSLFGYFGLLESGHFAIASSFNGKDFKSSVKKQYGGRR